jgi:hypothetical protein
MEEQGLDEKLIRGNLEGKFGGSGIVNGPPAAFDDLATKRGYEGPAVRTRSTFQRNGLWSKRQRVPQ